MIISHKHKFVFVKTVKTGGTSIEIALTPICGPEDIVTKLSDDDEEMRFSRTGRSYQNMKTSNKSGKIFEFRNHAPVRKARNYLESDFKNYFVFAFERNPFDRVVSAFHHVARQRKARGVDIQGLTFDRFVREGNCARLKRLHANGFGLYTIDGKVFANKVYKFELFNEAITDVFKGLHIIPPNEIPKSKVSDRKKDYRSYYNRDTRNLVERYFSLELKMYGYDF